jgi:hypothetical protein
MAISALAGAYLSTVVKMKSVRCIHGPDVCTVYPCGVPTDPAKRKDVSHAICCG